MRAINRIRSSRLRFGEWIFENITPHLPKIPTRQPGHPSGSTFCSLCHTDIKIYAYNTGDGWLFFWDCEQQHISNYGEENEFYIKDWFPFLFGWATGADLEKIGIEEV